MTALHPHVGPTARGLFVSTLGCLLCIPAGCSRPAASSVSGALAIETREFAIQGMMCENCVGHVTQAIQELPGVKHVVVSLEKKRATIALDPAQVPPQAVTAAVEKVGYKAQLIEPAAALPRVSR